MYIKKYGRWEAAVRESLECERDPENASDRYHRTFASKGIAVRCFCDGEVATIECTVTGCRKYSADLAQGGLEVPCSLLFKATLMEPVGSEACCLA